MVPVKVSSILTLIYLATVSAVNRPPGIFIEPQKDLYFKPKETVALPCVATGIPKPVYKWKFNGKDFNPSGQDDRVVQLPNQGTIVFNAPEDKDEGIYQCFADNDYGVSASVKCNLREAKLANFPIEDATHHRVNAGNSLTLPCTPPTSYPAADVYWVVKEPDGRWTPLNFGKRFTMDLEGRLRFVNVEKGDEQNGKAYACHVINYFMRKDVPGPEHYIQVSGTSEQKFPAWELWTSPSDQSAVKGNQLKLKCIFAGNPTPDVYWAKIEGTKEVELPPNAKYKAFGMELEINDIRIEDAGQYECMGLNTETLQRATKAFNVRVDAAPSWIDEPKDQEKSIGEKATFICKAEGSPPPRHDWYINGVLISNRMGAGTINNIHFLIPDKNNITFTDLTLEDHLCIQCNASNYYGYVFADVFLYVLAEKPSIIVSPQPEMKVAEGQSSEITCEVTGKPDPIVTWYRDRSLITGGRFKILPTGNLHIENAVMADAGNYRCQASNIYDNNVTSSICRMQVRRKTRIEQFPLDLEVVAGYDAKFTCSGSTDFDEAKHMGVFWEKDEKRVSVDEQRMSQNFQDNSLTISGTIVRDSGVYTCVVTNGLDEARATAFLTVKARPDPPFNVAVDRCRSFSADIKWIKGMENNAPSQYFIVQYNTSFNPDQWISAKTVDSSQNTANVELISWGNYTFRVISTNKIGQSFPSSHTTKVCSIYPDRPEKNPSNVRSIGNKSGYLIIEWTPMSELEHGGPGFFYALTVKERGSTKVENFKIDDWRNFTKEIQVANKAYNPYIVTLQAKNTQGDAKEDAPEISLYSFEDIPKVSPSNVMITGIGAREANVSWSWDVEWLEETRLMKDIQGKMRGFKIQYWRNNEKLATFREVDVLLEEVMPKPTTKSTTYKLTNLSPFSNMQIQICVMNTYYVGPPSNPIAFNTVEGVPGPVRNLKTHLKSSNSFTLIWNLPAVEDLNGILVGFDIAYQTVDGLVLGALHDRDQQIDEPDATITVLSGLLPKTKYRIYVFARTKEGRGEETFIEDWTTEKRGLGEPIFHIERVTENSINITWSPGLSYGAKVVHYVEYRLEGAADWQQGVDVVINNHYEITGLERGTYYEIRVVAYDGHNRRVSEKEVVGTEGFALARDIAANHGWFIGLILSLIAIIVISVFIWYVHRHRKDIEETGGKIFGGRTISRDQNDFERESRGQYNDYYKDDRKRNRNDKDYDRGSYTDEYKDKRYEAGADTGFKPSSYKNYDYAAKHFDQHSDDDRDSYKRDSYYSDTDPDYDRDRDYDRGSDYDRDYDRDRDNDRNYDQDDDYDRDYDPGHDYDRDSDRDSYNRDSYRDDYREYDRDKDYNRNGDDYEGYDSGRKPSPPPVAEKLKFAPKPVVAPKPPAGYDRFMSYEKPPSETDSYTEKYDQEPSKFDADGIPIEPPHTPSSSTFV